MLQRGRALRASGEDLALAGSVRCDRARDGDPEVGDADLPAALSSLNQEVAWFHVLKDDAFRVGVVQTMSSLAGTNPQDSAQLESPPSRLGAMNLIRMVLGVATFAAWFSTVVHGALSLAHLSGKSTFWQVISRARWLNAENFSPRGQELQRRFVRSFATFFCCAVLSFAISALTSLGR